MRTLASRNRKGIVRALEHARDAAEAVAVEETILQSYLFLGYPAALNAFAEWRAVSGHPTAPPRVDEEPWRERGDRVCRAVYAGQYDGLRDNVRALHADMEAWMVEEGYGKVLGRPGLDLRDRELCIAALLAVQDVPRQLYSHLRGALNVGAEARGVERALELAAEWSSDEARQNAADTWSAVQRRSTREEEPCS